jgi:hypothetical protein
MLQAIPQGAGPVGYYLKGAKRPFAYSAFWVLVPGSLFLGVLFLSVFFLASSFLDPSSWILIFKFSFLDSRSWILFFWVFCFWIVVPESSFLGRFIPGGCVPGRFVLGSLFLASSFLASLLLE